MHVAGAANQFRLEIDLQLGHEGAAVRHSL